MARDEREKNLLERSTEQLQENVERAGPAAGASYTLIGAIIVLGDHGLEMAKNDYQRLLPTFVLTKMPLVMQILFFGALLSAIKSTSSATLLAPSRADSTRST